MALAWAAGLILCVWRRRPRLLGFHREKIGLRCEVICRCVERFHHDVRDQVIRAEGAKAALKLDKLITHWPEIGECLFRVSDANVVDLDHSPPPVGMTREADIWHRSGRPEQAKCS